MNTAHLYTPAPPAGLKYPLPRTVSDITVPRVGDFVDLICDGVKRTGFIISINRGGILGVADKFNIQTPSGQIVCRMNEFKLVTRNIAAA